MVCQRLFSSAASSIPLVSPFTSWTISPLLLLLLLLHSLKIPRWSRYSPLVFARYAIFISSASCSSSQGAYYAGDVCGFWRKITLFVIKTVLTLAARAHTHMRGRMQLREYREILILILSLQFDAPCRLFRLPTLTYFEEEKLHRSTILHVSFSFRQVRLSARRGTHLSLGQKLLEKRFISSFAKTECRSYLNFI